MKGRYIKNTHYPYIINLVYAFLRLQFVICFIISIHHLSSSYISIFFLCMFRSIYLLIVYLSTFVTQPDQDFLEVPDETITLKREYILVIPMEMLLSFCLLQTI